ncbi:hypothetical protein HOE04_00125 [archaeon]|jgi:hypothetical protein|nr:hypothetical protein [archaeon]
MDPMPIPVKKPKRHWKSYLFLIFLGILAFLFYSAYNPSSFTGKITGNVIRDPTSFEGGSQVRAELKTSEEFEINSEIKKINLRINGPASFYIGKQKIDVIKDNSASIILDNFKGKVIISPGSKIELKGDSSTIFFDGLPISLDSGKGINTNLIDANYAYIKLIDFYLPSLSFETSGKIDIDNGKISVRSEGDKIKLPDFKGDLEARDDLIKIKGLVDKKDVNKLLESVS